MSEKSLSTFEREMQDASFKQEFDKTYSEFVLAETIRTLMEKDHKSVRKLAKDADVSPTMIQNIRSGIQEDIKLSNFLNISHACGYDVVLEKKGDRIAL